MAGSPQFYELRQQPEPTPYSPGYVSKTRTWRAEQPGYTLQVLASYFCGSHPGSTPSCTLHVGVTTYTGEGDARQSVLQFSTGAPEKTLYTLLRGRQIPEDVVVAYKDARDEAMIFFQELCGTEEVVISETDRT